MSQTGKSMPRYSCHKRVWAHKIRNIDPDPAAGGVIITPDEDGYPPFLVPKEYADRHHPQVGGYYVVYDDGYTSYSPSAAFVAGYTQIEGSLGLPDVPVIMHTNKTFGQAVEAMKQGMMASLESWNGEGKFVFAQVPSEVPAAIIPKMTSLPALVKARLEKRGLALKYQDQFAIVHADSSISGWSPSPSEVMATTWHIHETHIVADETVGMAKPLQ